LASEVPGWFTQQATRGDPGSKKTLQSVEDGTEGFDLSMGALKVDLIIDVHWATWVDTLFIVSCRIYDGIVGHCWP